MKASLREQAYSALDEDGGDLVITRAMEALRQAPKDVESYLLLSEVYEEQEKHEKALDWVLQGLAVNPANHALLLKKASILFDHFDDLDEAYKILRELYQKSEETDANESREKMDKAILIDIYLLLADCYRLKEDYKQAFFMAEKAWGLDQADENALLALATAHFELVEYDKALKIIEASKSEDGCDFDWLKGQIYCALGEFSKADESFAQAYKFDQVHYHRPPRISQSEFFSFFEQAVSVLPKEIRDFMDDCQVEIKAIIPKEFLLGVNIGCLPPSATVHMAQIKEGKWKIILFQKNIENLAHKKSEIRDVVSSVLLHALGQKCELESEEA